MTGSAFARGCAALVIAVLIVLLCLASADPVPPPVAVPTQADGTCPPGMLAAANLQTGVVECVQDPSAPQGNVVGTMPQKALVR